MASGKLALGVKNTFIDAKLVDVEFESCRRSRAYTDSHLEFSKVIVNDDDADTTFGSDTESIASYDEPPRTTIMLRNLPKNLTRNSLVAMLDEKHLRGKYDFVYLPQDYKHHVGFGYAFVNFTVASDAESCMTLFEGYSNWPMTSEKVCTVGWSNQEQHGIDAHIERFRNSPVMHADVPDEYKPMIFIEGERLPFPEPTTKIRAPPASRRRITARTRAALRDTA
jgi:hypothetical protein